MPLFHPGLELEQFGYSCIVSNLPTGNSEKVTAAALLKCPPFWKGSKDACIHYLRSPSKPHVHFTGVKCFVFSSSGWFKLLKQMVCVILLHQLFVLSACLQLQHNSCRCCSAVQWQTVLQGKSSPGARYHCCSVGCICHDQEWSTAHCFDYKVWRWYWLTEKGQILGICKFDTRSRISVASLR